MATLVRWNPVREMASVQNMMDRMFDESIRNLRPINATVDGNRLALDVHEDDANYIVTTALAGVSEDNITINLHDDLLTIEAEIPVRTTEKEGTRTLIQERSYGKYTRRIRLPHPVNAEKVEAQYVDGELTLTLPKAEHALPRTIPVKRLNGQN